MHLFEQEGCRLCTYWASASERVQGMHLFGIVRQFPGSQPRPLEWSIREGVRVYHVVLSYVFTAEDLLDVQGQVLDVNNVHALGSAGYRELFQLGDGVADSRGQIVPARRGGRSALVIS